MFGAIRTVRGRRAADGDAIAYISCGFPVYFFFHVVGEDHYAPHHSKKLLVIVCRTRRVTSSQCAKLAGLFLDFYLFWIFFFLLKLQGVSKQCAWFQRCSYFKLGPFFETPCTQKRRS